MTDYSDSLSENRKGLSLLVLRKIIAEEDKSNPLSDQKITDMLTDKDLDISRRTVAKYRAALCILGRTHRKEF